MIEKIFIKDYKNTEEPDVRRKYGIVSGFFGIFTNVLLFIIKLVLGFFSNSITIMADAFNNLSDSFSSIITIIGFKISSKPADQEHPYGHARYEYIAGIIVAFLVFLVGITFIKSSIQKIIFPEEINLGVITYITLIIAIIIKLLQMLVYIHFSKVISSKVIKANALDARNDIITTLTVLLAMIVMAIFNINIDGYIGLVISCFIVVSAIKMIKETIDPMIGIMPSDEQIEKIKNEVLKYDKVQGVHDLLIHNYGIGKDFVTIHIEVSSKMNIIDAHNLADEIERHFKDDLNLNLTIHVDPIDIENIDQQRLYDRIKKGLKNFDDSISLHDFRIITCQNEKKTIMFDMVIPYDKEYSKEQIDNLLQKLVMDEKEKYAFLVNIERPMAS